MSELRSAFSVDKHRAVKELKHKEKVIYVSTQDIFNAQVKYGEWEHKKYVEDRFWQEHRCVILDFEKLVFYTTLDDNIMKIAGHMGYSISEPKE